LLNAKRKRYHFEIFVFIFLLILGTILFAQNNEFPSYDLPIMLPPKLTSVFGEYRKSKMESSPHFHSGVDFSVDWQVGKKLVAAQDGYVKRVVVDENDIYGDRIVLAHREGYVTLYSHFSAFAGNVQKIIEMLKEEFGDNRIEITFKPNDVNVKRGQIIGYSGKTGDALIPHCHFEVRSEDEKWVYNPLFFLRLNADGSTMRIKKITIDGVDYKSDEIKDSVVHVDGSQFPRMSIATDEENRKNTRGIYKIQMYANDNLIFELRFDKMKMEEFRKTSILYGITYDTYDYYTYKLTIPSDVSLSSIKINKIHSIMLNKNKKIKIKIIVSNFWGREKEIEFFLKGDRMHKEADKIGKENIVHK